MNRGYFKKSFKKYILDFFVADDIMDYLEILRKTSYYYDSVLGLYYRIRLKRLGIKLGFSIGCNSLGYGLLLPHYGTIVVGVNSIGNYAVLQSSTCISGNNKTIGNGLYMATGAKITAKIDLGDNVTVGANAVVNKSFPEGNVLLVGIPAVEKKVSGAWYLNNGDEFRERVQRIEELKIRMGI